MAFCAFLILVCGVKDSILPFLIFITVTAAPYIKSKPTKIVLAPKPHVINMSIEARLGH